MNVKDIALRAAKTFVQTFLALATVEVVAAGDLVAIKSAAVAALAAAISVVWNAVLQWSQT
jgi:hypothetical protein